jgi:hypothetical protein
MIQLPFGIPLRHSRSLWTHLVPQDDLGKVSHVGLDWL